MTLQDIEKEIPKLAPEEQDRLTALLFHLRHRDDPEYKARIAQRLDDRDSSHWIPASEFDPSAN
jgi:hypothetical protein